MAKDMPIGSCCVCDEDLDLSDAGICKTCGQGFCWKSCGGWHRGEHACFFCSEAEDEPAPPHPEGRGMGKLLKSAREGFVGAFKLFGFMAKLFLLHLPCILFLALPAFVIGYAWCWVVGGFRWGELTFVQATEDKTREAVFWRVDISAPFPTRDGDGGRDE